jgi:RNA-binding protein YlmH
MGIRETESTSVFLSRLADLAARSQRDCAPYCTMFLDEMQCAAATEFLKWQADIAYFFWGGYEQADRKCCCLYPEFLEPDKTWVPCRCVTVHYSNLITLEHRDFLGAALNCGLKRETIGDILIEKGLAQLWATDTAAALLTQTLEKVGRSGVRCSDTEPFSIVPVKKRLAHHGTVSSLRCDAIAALVTRQSREKAVRMIQQGNMERIGHTVLLPSEHMQTGDIFVIRGSGKFQLISVSEPSKKGRLHVFIEQYK